MIRSIIIYSLLGILAEILAQRWISKNLDYIHDLDEYKRIKKNFRIKVFIAWIVISTLIDWITQALFVWIVTQYI